MGGFQPSDIQRSDLSAIRDWGQGNSRRLSVAGYWSLVAGLHSLNNHIDTSTPNGKLTFHLSAALAEFERDIIRERTNAGFAAARARGRKGGRPKGLSQKAKHTAIIAERLYEEGDLTINEICEQLSISKMTLYNYLQHRGVEIGAARKKKVGA
jgi:DNA invertase Pin-like site-specific DNA recombinase